MVTFEQRTWHLCSSGLQGVSFGSRHCHRCLEEGWISEYDLCSASLTPADISGTAAGFESVPDIHKQPWELRVLESNNWKV